MVAGKPDHALDKRRGWLPAWFRRPRHPCWWLWKLSGESPSSVWGPENRPTVAETQFPRSISLTEPWNLALPSGWGAPGTVRVYKLSSWTELELPPAVRAFSGTATYTTEFTLEPLAVGARMELDLGRVEVIATVHLNGQLAGTAWTPPYRLGLTRLAKPGVNRLAVAVTSIWFNRLSYDAGLDEKARKPWTSNGPAKGPAFEPAGMLGPVTVRTGQILEASEAR